VRVIPSAARLTGAQVGRAFALTVKFSEPMDTTAAPRLTFTGGALRFRAGRWSSVTTYVAVYTVVRTNVDVPRVAVHVSGARDAAGNPQVTTTANDVFAVAMRGPRVLAVTRLDRNPTSALSVRFRVTFSAEVRGVDARDFRLVATGTVRGARVLRVQRLSGRTYVVSVAPGVGRGGLRLDLLDNGSIFDLFRNPLGGIGSANGSFRGPAYTVRL
jgi:hypothetical protein